MSHIKYTTIDALFASYTPEQYKIISELRTLFMSKPGTTEAVKRNYLYFCFPNGMWFYVSCKKESMPTL